MKNVEQVMNMIIRDFKKKERFIGKENVRNGGSMQHHFNPFTEIISNSIVLQVEKTFSADCEK